MKIPQEKIDQLNEIILRSNRIVFLEVQEHQQKVTFLIFEAKEMDFTISGMKKAYHLKFF